jgi:hypothetical protein
MSDRAAVAFSDHRIKATFAPDIEDMVARDGKTLQ